jgi:colicin import membrane protein
MHAEVLHHRHDRDREDLWPSVALAVGVHVAIALLFFLGSIFSWEREMPAAAGLPSLEASLDMSASEARAAERALERAEDIEPLPAPIEEPAEEETVPPPQPIPEPRPQDSPVPQQQVAQERVPVPDTTEQERADALAVSREKALREQEEKRRQEQIDLTERQRQEEAERRQRLAAQQAEAERQKKLDEIRRQRAQLEREQALAQQKLRQITEARARQAAAASAQSEAATASPPAGNAGADPNLSGEYAAAIQRAVLSQWVRPDSVPLGQRCSISIRQLPGGEVVEARVSPSCPYDDAGKRSIEAAVLRAQPLPYRGFESVFQRNLTFNFTAQDR